MELIYRRIDTDTNRYSDEEINQRIDRQIFNFDPKKNYLYKSDTNIAHARIEYRNSNYIQSYIDE